MKQKLLLLYIAFSFFACKPEPDRTPDKHINYYLTAEQLAKTPYFTNPAFDTLTFVSNQNDTVVFAKTRVDSGWYKLTDMDVGREYLIFNYYQQLTAKYQTIKGEGSFEVVHSKRINNGNTDMLKIVFNNYNFTFGDQVIGNMLHPNYKELIQINNNIFEFIISVKTDNPSENIEGYINKKYGIFYILDKSKGLEFLITK
ncbi:MAG: hypothetical protein Q8R57_02220 [Bacteroidota bacterium]|nr:hypothetical protein [Bacteroidota bacterium]